MVLPNAEDQATTFDGSQPWAGEDQPRGRGPPGSPVPEASCACGLCPSTFKETEACGHVAAKQQEWPQLPGSTQNTG